MKPIILASTSPRRVKILQELSIPFEQVTPFFDEIVPEKCSYNDVPELFAKEKALSVLPHIKNYDSPFVLGLDTIIVHNNTIFGKPKDSVEAKKILKTLSGAQHSVITGIAIYNRKTELMHTKRVTSLVTIKELTDIDIDWYLQKNEWQDAAGAYKAQGYFQRYILRIEGSFSSILGLPIFEFYDIMQSQGYVFT